MRNFKKFLTLVLAVMMVVSAMSFTTSAVTTKFEDVDADNEVLVKAVDLLSYMNVTKGTSETTFGADELVTRQQFALFMYRLMKGGKDAPVGAANTTKFTDLEDPTYFYAISWANANGIVNGRSENSFSPKDPIKLKEAYAMITRALEWEKENTVYPYGHIEIAEQTGVALDNGLNPSIDYDDELTRADMAILLYNAFFAETGVEKVVTREAKFSDGSLYLKEYITNPTLCEKTFGVIEVEYQAVATPHYMIEGGEKATYDLGYDAIYFKMVENSDVNAEAGKDIPAAMYLTAEDLGLEASELDNYFLGHFTLFVTVEDMEIERVLFADCDMVKKTVTDLELGEVSTNKASSYYEGTEAKLLSGKLTANGTEEMYLFNAPYNYSKESSNIGDDADKKYEARNFKNLGTLTTTGKIEDNNDIVYTVVTEDYAISSTYDEDGLYIQEGLDTIEMFEQVYYNGLYEADLYDVNGDGIYDYIDYKPYTFFQVDSDDEEYFEDSDFEADIPYIYTNEAAVLGEKFADEDYVIGYFSEELETVKIVAVVKPTVDTIKKQDIAKGVLTLTGDEKVSIDNRLVSNTVSSLEDIVFEGEDYDAYIEALVAGSDLFDRVALTADELEFYVYNGVLLKSDEVDVNVKFSENLIIPTNDKKVIEGKVDLKTGDSTYYVYAWVNGKAQYVEVALDDELLVDIVDIDTMTVTEDYADMLCTYTEDKDIYTITPLAAPVHTEDCEDDCEKTHEAMSNDITILDAVKNNNQVLWVADSTIEGFIKKASTRFDIGLEDKVVVLKPFTKVVIKVTDEDGDVEYVTYDADTLVKSLNAEEGDAAFENVQAIIANNPDSKSREDLVLLYAEVVGEVTVKGTTDKNGYRIISGYEVDQDDEGYWRYFYEAFNPYIGIKVKGIPSEVKGKKPTEDYLGEAIPAGTIIELVDGMVDEKSNENEKYWKGLVGEANLLWITEVDTINDYISVVPYDATQTKTTIEDYVEEHAEDTVYDIYGTEIGSNFIDIDRNTVITVIYNSDKESTMTLSNVAEIEAAKNNVLCYNEKATNRNGTYKTQYADYIKCYVSVDTDVEEDENPIAEFIIIVVNANEPTALNDVE